MPRRPLIRTDSHPYHVTQRSNNKEWFYLPLNEVWSIAIRALNKAMLETSAIVHAFVLMNNHYHLLVSTPNANLDKFQWFFSNQFTRKIQQKTRRINHIFGGRYRWSLIQDNQYYMQVYKYIYLNPVRAGIVRKVEQYPYSTLPMVMLAPENWILEERPPSTFRISDPFLEEYTNIHILNWINESFNKEQTDNIKKGIRKTKFEISCHPEKRKSITYTPLNEF